MVKSRNPVSLVHSTVYAINLLFCLQERGKRLSTIRICQLLLLVVLILGVTARGDIGKDVPDIYFQHISEADGLTFNYVTSILEDPSGFIWIGTLNGLDRYDGYSFKHYRYDVGDQKLS